MGSALFNILNIPKNEHIGLEPNDPPINVNEILDDSNEWGIADLLRSAWQASPHTSELDMYDHLKAYSRSRGANVSNADQEASNRLY